MKCILCEKKLSWWDRFVRVHDCRAEYMDKMVDDLRERVDSYKRSNPFSPAREEVLRWQKEFTAREKAAASEFYAQERRAAAEFRAAESAAEAGFQSQYRVHRRQWADIFKQHAAMWGTAQVDTGTSIRSMQNSGMSEAEILRFLKTHDRMDEFLEFRSGAIDIRSQGEGQA